MSNSKKKFCLLASLLCVACFLSTCKQVLDQFGGGVACKKYPSIPHHKWAGKLPVNSGQAIKGKCNTGYKSPTKKGPSATCTNGRWSISSRCFNPRNVAGACRNFPSAYGAEWDPNLVLEEGSRASTRCKRGFAIYQEAPSGRCKKGRFVFDSGTCVPQKSCFSPPALAHVKWKLGTEITSTERVRLDCEGGYAPGPVAPKATCIDGVWYDTEGSCKIGACDPTKLPTIRRVVWPRSFPHQHNDTVRASCEEGLHGYVEATCDASTGWVTRGTCHTPQCSTLPEIEGGLFKSGYRERVFDDRNKLVLHGRCKLGYRGYPQAVCESDGWTVTGSCTRQPEEPIDGASIYLGTVAKDESWCDVEFDANKRLWAKLQGQSGGCGTFSTFLTMRKLAHGDVELSEIDHFFEGKSATTIVERAGFLESKGFLSFRETIYACREYAHMKAFLDEGCAIELAMRSPDDKNGHVEYVHEVIVDPGQDWCQAILHDYTIRGIEAPKKRPIPRKTCRSKNRPPVTIAEGEELEEATEFTNQAQVIEGFTGSFPKGRRPQDTARYDPYRDGKLAYQAFCRSEFELHDTLNEIMSDATSDNKDQLILDAARHLFIENTIPIRERLEGVFRVLDSAFLPGDRITVKGRQATEVLTTLTDSGVVDNEIYDGIVSRFSLGERSLATTEMLRAVIDSRRGHEIYKHLMALWFYRGGQKSVQLFNLASQLVFAKGLGTSILEGAFSAFSAQIEELSQATYISMDNLEQLWKKDFLYVQHLFRLYLKYFPKGEATYEYSVDRLFDTAARWRRGLSGPLFDYTEMLIVSIFTDIAKEHQERIPQIADRINEGYGTSVSHDPRYKKLLKLIR